MKFHSGVKGVSACLLVLTLFSPHGYASGQDIATDQTSAAPIDITLFSFNDLHGHLQSSKPAPFIMKDPDHPGNRLATGGYEYLSALLKARRAAVGPSLTVAAGDLIGASPLNSALLDDEPVFEAMNRLGLSASAVGNHEFDHGYGTLKSRIKGQCPDHPCKMRDFAGAQFDYLAANVTDAHTGLPAFTPYVIRQIGPVKMALIGAVTRTTPNMVSRTKVEGIRFEDEASAVNRYIPELKKQGVDSIVLLIHEGLTGAPAQDATYRCEGAQGALIDINKRLDPAVDLIISGHTHTPYTCKFDGRLLVEARGYGATLTETHLRFDAGTHRMISSSASNLIVDQTRIQPDADAHAWMAQINAQSESIRNQPVATLQHAISSEQIKGDFDSLAGRVVADSMLAFARQSGPADLAFMNNGGVRTSLGSADQHGPIALTYADVAAVLPFGNRLLRLTLTGREVLAFLQDQWSGESIDPDSASGSLRYHFHRTGPASVVLSDIRLDGKPLEPDRDYVVVFNSFEAGADAPQTARNLSDAGSDVEALAWYLGTHAKEIDAGIPPRTIQADSAPLPQGAVSENGK